MCSLKEKTRFGVLIAVSVAILLTAQFALKSLFVVLFMGSQKNLIIVALIGFLIVTAFIYFRSTANSMGETSGRAFFTTDDGQTWFKDDLRKLPPFDHNGKQAYRCYLYTTDGGKTTAVSHLERYSDEAKKTMEHLRQNGGKTDPSTMQILVKGLEVKRPGAPDSEWMNKSDPRAAAITIQQGPGIQGAERVPVEP